MKIGGRSYKLLGKSFLPIADIFLRKDIGVSVNEKEVIAVLFPAFMILPCVWKQTVCEQEKLVLVLSSIA